jgi:hypothetical protein
VNALKSFAIGAEVTVISTLAVSSYNVAFSGHEADWLAGAPLLTVCALESLRLPIAFRLARMRLTGLVCSAALLAGLSVITGEAASIGFENLIFQRSRPVVEAERDLARAEIGLAALQDAANSRTADIEAARRHRSDIDKAPALQPVPESKTCSLRRGGSWACSAPVQAQAVASNAAAMKSHAEELKAASAAIRTAEARPAPDLGKAGEAVAEAKRRVADARAMNPMFRVAATWQRVPVEDLTSVEFEVVKHWAVIALATATAVTTALAAVISSLPDRTGKPSRLARAIRLWLVGRRRALHRLGAETKIVDRIVRVREFVPTHPETGMPLDRRSRSPAA